MEFSKLQYLPIFMYLWFMSTFVLTYVISVIQKDVEPIFPYISDTGTFTPTSCIFGQLLNVGSILLSIIIYIRYLQIKEINGHLTKGLYSSNVTCLILGWLASLGVGLVANFQETEVFSIHIFGAIMAFGLGSVYQLIQCHISAKTMKECRISQHVVNFRWILGIVSTVTFFTCFCFAGLAMMKYQGTDMTKWKKADGGYSLHLVSTITEWILGVATMTYVFTFTFDFQHFKLIEPTLQFFD